MGLFYVLFVRCRVVFIGLSVQHYDHLVVEEVLVRLLSYSLVCRLCIVCLLFFLVALLGYRM